MSTEMKYIEDLLAAPDYEVLEVGEPYNRPYMTGRPILKVQAFGHAWRAEREWIDKGQGIALVRFYPIAGGGKHDTM